MAPCRWVGSSSPTRPRSRFSSPNASFPRARTDANPLLAGELISSRRVTDNNGIAAGTGQACSAEKSWRELALRGGDRVGIRRLARRHLGDLDLDPQLDLAKQGIEAGIARAILEQAGGRTQLAEGGLRQGAAEQPDLELVERIERYPAALNRMLATLGRVLEPLQGNERIDAADGAQRGRRRCRAGLSASPSVKALDAGLRMAGAAAAAAVPLGPEMRMAKALAPRPWMLGAPAYPRLLWLIDGKRPGKICRTRQGPAWRQPRKARRPDRISFRFNCLSARSGWHGFRKAKTGPNLLGSKG